MKISILFLGAEIKLGTRPPAHTSRTDNKVYL